MAKKLTRIEQAVRDFNAKVDRVRAEQPQIAHLQPNKVSLQQIKASLTGASRSESERVISNLKRYMMEGAETPYTTAQNVLTTVWEKEITEANIEKLNRNKAKQLSAANKRASIYTGTLHAVDDMNLKRRQNLVEEIQPKDWKNYVESIDRAAYNSDPKVRNELYKANYLRAVANTFGEDSPLYDIMSKAKSSEIIDSYFSNAILGIDFVYDEHDARTVQERIIREWYQDHPEALNGRDVDDILNEYYNR